MARPAKEVDTIKMFELYSKGLVDSEIAKQLGTSRASIVRRRQDFNLKANRKIGDRGPAVKENELYWVAARRALRYVGRFIQNAAREYYEETGDYNRYFISMIMEPRPMFHACPGPHKGKEFENMNFTDIKYITDFEEAVERTALSGCPGPAIIDLAKIYKTADEETCMKLAREAVEGSGYVKAHLKVSDVIFCDAPELHKTFWERIELETMAEAPVQDWAPPKKIPKNAYSPIRDGAGRTGKKGRGGGTQSINNARAYLAAAGY